MSAPQTPAEKLRFDNENVRDRLILVDGHALIYRAYHAFPELTDHTGMLVNAVFGFTRILLTTIRDFHPEYLAVCFDSKEKTKRAEEFEAYKANRPEMPDDLKPQIEIIKSVVAALNIPQFAVPGLEADDLIGSFSSQLYEKNTIDQPLTIVLTGDKDLLQLVDDNVHVFIPARSKTRGDIEYDVETVERQMGLRPDQIVDMKALMGDASDNIPGVKGIGPKTAVAILQLHQTLDGVYAAAEEIEKSGAYVTPFTKSVVAKLVADKNQAYQSQKLATIQRDHHLEFKLETCKVSSYNKEEAVKILQQYDFRSLISLLPRDSFEVGVQAALF
jgi:DNA polymerase-1